MKKQFLKLWKKLPRCHYYTEVVWEDYLGKPAALSHEEITFYVWAFGRKWDVLTFKKDW